ncbi:MAG: energy transducer TonB [Thermodesulfobacteriota bacterium]
MKKYKLNKFVLLSVGFHVILIAAVLLYFFRYPLSKAGSGDVRSGTVMVGLITSEKESENQQVQEKQDSDSKPEIITEQKPLNEIIKKEIVKKPKTKKVEKIPNKKKPVSKAEQITANTSQKSSNTDQAGIKESSSKTNAQVASISEPKYSLAYPDYNHNPKPYYPRSARKRGYEGEVKLKVLVLADGRVGDIEVLRPSGHQILDDSALDAVKNWIFVPGKENGKEISSWVTVPITFQLKNG